MAVERKSSTRRRARLAGPLVAGFVLLLFALQGLFANGLAAHSDHGAGKAGFSVSLHGADCAVNDQSDDGPTRKRGHAQCCVLCGARDLGLAVLPSEARFGIRSAPREEPAAAEWRVGDLPRQFPSGWASSWSSQAPPFFS